jgi:hypothetical protein
LWWQVVALKLIAGAATVAAALAGRIVTRTFSPEHGDLTLLAIGMNPLFLIEGPGNGHNDMLMVALMLSGLALYAKGQKLSAYFVLGLSAGVKFVTAGILPWILLDDIRRRPFRGALATAALSSLIFAAPNVLGFVPFWRGMDTFRGISSVYTVQTRGNSPALTDAPAEGEAQTTGASPRLFFESLTIKHWALVFTYVVLTIALWRRPSSGGHLSAWSLFALGLCSLAAPVWFPWYTLWAWSVSLTRWNRPHLALSCACLMMSIYLVVQYADPHVVR